MKPGSERPIRLTKVSRKPDLIIDAAVAGGGGSPTAKKLQADLDAGNPPDTFQAHAGAELTDYISAGQIEDVSALYDPVQVT